MRVLAPRLYTCSARFYELHFHNTSQMGQFTYHAALSINLTMYNEPRYPKGPSRSFNCCLEWKLTELPTSFSDIFRQSFADTLHLPHLMKFACVRERYPLTSQLIQENKIPEFGEYLFDWNLVWPDRFVQTTCTSISTALFTIVSLIIQYNPLILWPFHQARIQTTGMPTSGYPRSKYLPPYSPTSITFSGR